VKQHESAARSNVGGRPSLDIPESTYGRHEPTVNVPPARVESEKPTATLVAGVFTTLRAAGIATRCNRRE